MIFLWLIRLAFLGLLTFEGANYIRLLHFTIDYTWFGLLITSLVVLVGLELLTKFLQKFEGAALHWSIWLLAFVMVASDAFGDLFHWYSRWSWYDQINHFSGSAVATAILLVIFLSCRARFAWRFPDFLLGFLALGGASFLGAVYEIEEYLEDFFNLTNRLGDGPDTGNDLFMNTVGSLTIIGIFLLSRYVRRKTNR
ncbi:hypothetical protein HY628_01435 [Candidatus Uhrbacteria bacterium]|nr:hypothetical protein [Candidatus Uhrbacteria bacterium]